MLDPPGDTVAAGGMRVSHRRADANTTVNRALPRYRDEALRRRVNGDLMRRDAARDVLDVVGGIRDEARQLRPAPLPATNRRPLRELLRERLQCDRRDAAPRRLGI